MKGNQGEIDTVFGSFEGLQQETEQLKVKNAESELSARRIELVVERARDLFKKQKLLERKDRALGRRGVEGEGAVVVEDEAASRVEGG